MDITLILVTLLSLTLAAVMAALAWRVAREERRRSDARVAALASEIHHDAPGYDLRLRDRAVAQSGDLFTSALPSPSRSRPGVVMALGVFVVCSGLALAVVLSGRHSTAKTSVESGNAPAGSGMHRTPQGNQATARDAAPLELIALTHERDADRLTVRGIIRNPASGAEVSRLTAVVFLFDRDGGFVTSGRAAVDAPELVPGADSTFVVTIPGVADVGRYRVSFRTDDRVVPHLDRRDRAMAQAR
jgi:hypothetical protein